MTCGDVSDRARVAAAGWSRVAEAADVAASALIAHMGVEESWEWLTSGDDVDAVFSAPNEIEPAAKEQLRRARLRWIPRVRDAQPQRDLDTISALGGRLLIPGDPEWPEALDNVDHPRPWCVWLRGRDDTLARLTRACAGLVGARSASRYGMDTAFDLAAGASAQGVAVISGGAYGIDTAALRGALGTGVPVVAVLAGGLDRFYPAQNAGLFRAIMAEGALVSHYPPGARPTRWRFLERNRTIAALSSATIVVEAATRSGALNTARYARDLGRHLGAVPGPVNSLTSQGCHRLIREGATLVAGANDIVEMVSPLGTTHPQAQPVRGGTLDGLTGNDARVFDALPARQSSSLDSLTRAAGLSTTETLAALGSLELSGAVARDGAKWRRAR
ncbi:MAG: DNA-processing protein DprA [Actinomycetaceae bacterium]|nr:DNA-processing protein DprA [Actinomycetaceae bacterium]